MIPSLIHPFYNILIWFIFGSVFLTNPKDTWIIKSSSSVTVNGKTNINTFSCKVSSYGKTDTLHCFPDKKNANYYPVHTMLKVPVKQFDCGNPIMTKDLQKTLKVTQYPNVIIELSALSALPDINSTAIEGQAYITLAGTKRYYTIPFKTTRQKNHMLLIGKKQIRFTEFKLTPPTKLGGSIRVDDVLEVEVTLVMEKKK
ncbi:MAG: hypothetical protein IPN79_13930 [Saprospiraceae bacterium]|nr:hypothetical protein [Saprospiraceae bacterium]